MRCDRWAPAWRRRSSEQGSLPLTVQLLPTRDPSLPSLVDVVDIVGGSGRFDGADGELTFSGDGPFVSPVQALMRFVFEGRVQAVD